MLKTVIFLYIAICLFASIFPSATALATEPELPNAIPAQPTHVDLGDIPGWLAEMPPAAKRGYHHLIDSVYLPADLDEVVAVELQNMLLRREHRDEDSSRKDNSNDSVTELPSEVELRRQLFSYYGLTPRPGDPAARNPLQYVVTEKGDWVMNCFACHGGSVYGTPMPGAPNNAYQLQSFVEDIRIAKLQLSKPLGHMEIGSLFMPLGTTAGTTNAVMFGVALMNFRDADLNVLTFRRGTALVNHDMDPPAWWLMHRKKRIYADGFAEKGHRGLMQFMLVRENGPEKFREWEDDFRDVLAFIETLRPPKYTQTIDAALAERGRTAFNDHCSRCHGTYGIDAKYPELLIPIEEIGTDRVRLDSLSVKHRAGYGASWFAGYGEQETWEEPKGYMAPPLDGIWASAPYLHNGSVPTLWHLLNPDQRPAVWRRTATELDTARVGLTVEELESVPRKIGSPAARRNYFDTGRFGKSAAGHELPFELTPAERTAVLEYLKTL